MDLDLDLDMDKAYAARVRACGSLGELFALWQEKPAVEEGCWRIDHRRAFIRDGVVNPAVWEQLAGPRICFVLKEAYGEAGSWDLAEWLREGLREGRPDKRIWRRVIEWTYGLSHSNRERAARYYPGIYEEERDLLNKIAVVNLKKSDGRRASDYGEIGAYAWADREEIRRELALIGPDIVVCGSTFGALNRAYGERLDLEGERCDNWFYFTEAICGRRTLVLDYYHPANRYPALLNFYGLVGIYRQALLAEPDWGNF